MKGNFIILIFIVFLFSFLGCFDKNEEKIIKIGEGILVEKSEEGFNLITKEKFLSAEFEIKGVVYEDEIIVSDEYLSIKQKNNDSIIIALAFFNEKSDNILFSIKNEKKIEVNIKNSIKKDTFNNIELKKAGEPKLLGDYNNDMEVNIQDFNVFKQNYGKNSTIYDIGPAAKGTNEWADIYCYLQGDGKVGLEDLTVFVSNYEKKLYTVGNITLEKEKLSVKPGENYPFIVNFDSWNYISELSFKIILKDIFKNKVKESDYFIMSNKIEISTDNMQDGAYIVYIEVYDGNKNIILNKEELVISIVSNTADDLRYGFYTKWDEIDDDYSKKSKAFMDLNINAVEYYDYFPAHGKYAPTESEYRFEPFGTLIKAEDISKKIEDLKTKNIKSIAYVSAYAASKSIIEKDKTYYIMRYDNENGEAKVFGDPGEIRAESKFLEKDRWFWLTAVHRGSVWYNYIMEEFKKTIDDSTGDYVSFDGFELDTYNDDSDTKYYAKGAGYYNGYLLKDVMKEFIGDVRDTAKSIKNDALVSYNCVNEAGIENMYDVTDFIFIEIWPWHRTYISNLTDICYYHRSKKNQRVVLKLYPYKMEKYNNFNKDEDKADWPVYNLKYIMGAVMTGGGSFMTVGEPDEYGNMNMLNTEYYPHFVKLNDENYDVLKRYYEFDALMYGFNHGKNVSNVSVNFNIPNNILARTFYNDKNYLVINMLNEIDGKEWTKELEKPIIRNNMQITLDSYNGKIPKKIYYGTPDSEYYSRFKEIQYNYLNGKIELAIPELEVFGSLVIEY